MATTTDFITTMTSAFEALFDATEKKLNAQFDDYGLKGSEKAGLLAQAIPSIHATALQVAVKSITISNEDILLSKQVETENSRKLLIDRQTSGFDDKLRIEKAKTLGEALGLTANATGSIDSGLSTKYSSAIDAIVPVV